MNHHLLLTSFEIIDKVFVMKNEIAEFVNTQVVTWDNVKRTPGVYKMDDADNTRLIVTPSCDLFLVSETAFLSRY